MGFVLSILISYLVHVAFGFAVFFIGTRLFRNAITWKEALSCALLMSLGCLLPGFFLIITGMVLAVTYLVKWCDFNPFFGAILAFISLVLPSMLFHLVS